VSYFWINGGLRIAIFIYLLKNNIVNKLPYVYDDFEREFHKDYIYLLEQQMEEEQAFWEEENRKPANIIVLIDKNINLKKHEKAR
jgi:hypothetical protein